MDTDDCDKSVNGRDQDTPSPRHRGGDKKSSEKSSDSPAVTLTIRVLMQGKEVGSIIGNKGEIVKRFREESGARINISDGSCPERIVTVTGHTDSIIKAFHLICSKFEEDLQNAPGIPKAPITLRLIVPASQCGSLIGKGGSKIKEIREITGASIQVASEMLPNSTERAVTISGMCEAMTQCIYHICCVMLESPPKGATIPYRPRAQVGGGGNMMMSGGQGYLHGNMGMHSNHDGGNFGGNALAGLLGLGGGGGSGGLSALAALAGSQIARPGSSSGRGTQTHEMSISNELIGCIIGKGGSKIAEIRQMSGATIRISHCDEREKEVDRKISISGNAESVALAQYLINTSIELHKATAEGSEGRRGGDDSSSQGIGVLPLAKLLASNPQFLANALGSLSSLTDMLGGGSHHSGGIQTTGVHRGYGGSNRYGHSRMRGSGPDSFRRSDRKFNPY